MKTVAFLTGLRPLACIVVATYATLGIEGLLSTTEAQAVESVSVAAAADLKYALDEIVVKFTESHPDIRVQVSYGSSGNFYAQLSQRAPFDIFFSADVLYPKKLMEAGLASADSQFTYAVGRIVVWAPHSSPLDLPKLGLEALRHPSVRKIAIANPEHAPYGKAAVAAMRKLGVYDTVKQRLVYGENVAQAAQFVESGSADLGIIALSLAVGPALKNKGRYWEVPLEVYPRLEQGGVILSWAQNRSAARQFRDFVISPSGRKTLRGYGFFPPTEQR